MKRNNMTWLSVVVMAVSPTILMAAGKSKTNPLMDWMYENIFLVLSGMVILAAGATIWSLMNTMVEIRRRA